MPMSERNDPATPTLLCLENIDICFDDCQSNVVDRSPSWDHKKRKFNNLYLIKENHGSEPLMGFLIHSDEYVGFLIEREKDHFPRDDYLKRLRSEDLDLGAIRGEALELISKIHANHDLGPFSFCLSVNYLDRFLSVHESQSDPDWAVGYLAVACASIASKVEGNKFPKFTNLEVGERNFEFYGKAHQRMELMMLSRLNWKMQALTPCSFLDYFLGKMSYEQQLADLSFSRSVELIVNIAKGVDFLEFKPSEIATAVAISVSRKLQPKDIDEALTCVSIIEKERVLKCLELMRDFLLIKFFDDLGNNLAPLVPESPIGVLDDACLSSEGDALTVGSYTNNWYDSPNPKRFKSFGPSDGTF